MRSVTFRRAAIVATLACLAAGAGVPVSAVGCAEITGRSSDSIAPSEGAEPASAASPVSAAAVAALDVVRARFARVIDASPRDGQLAALEPAGGGALHAEHAAGAAIVELPGESDGPVRIADEASGVAVSFALEGAGRAPVGLASGLAIYPDGAPSGGDVLHRVTPSGTEDFVYFPETPAAERLRYRVGVSKVAGLRLVSRTLEFLDAKGAPRLRVAPPYVVDAGGRWVAADLTLEGCAFDASPRAPWGRPVTSPGATACTVVVTWSNKGVAYPALVDPAWILTKNMAFERAQHAIAALPNPVTSPADASPVLITGGFDKNDVPLASAEIYEPLSRTFAVTGSMLKARAAHTATALVASNIGHVFVAGGAATVVNKNPPEQLAFGSLADGATTELYNPQTGTFALGPSMSSPRFRHVAATLNDGRVLLAGGIADLVNQPTKSADVFTFDPATPPGTIAPTAGQLVAARYAHAATRLTNGDILITGGIGTSSFALLTGETFTPSTGFFATTPTQMTAGRAFHTATRLSTNEVLIAGGINSQNAPIAYSSTADVYSNGAFSLQAITMSAPRAFHTATLLTPASVVTPGATPEMAEVIFAGGFDGLADVATVDAYLPVTKKILAFPVSMQRSRRHAASLLVNAGAGVAAGRAVLVTGGVDGSATSGGNLTNGQSTRSAEVLAKGLGDPCVTAGECLSGFCADAVCCNKGCTEECFSCASAKKEDGSADGTCGPTKADTPLPVKCFGDPVTNEHVEVHNECDGLGKAKPGALTKSCKPATCNAAGTACTTLCSAASPCASSGWCDYDQAPDGGVPADAGPGPFGTCSDKKVDSLPCNAGEECRSKFCIDGVCCNLPCQGQCQACDLPGFVGACTNVGSVEPGGQPHGNDAGEVFDPDAGVTVDGGSRPRPACNGFGTNCGGGCFPTTSDKCEYPDGGTELNAAACADKPTAASTLTRFLCDSAGGSFDSPSDCGGFRCAEGATSCKATCSRKGDAGDGDCIQDFICEEDGGQGTCVSLTTPRCDGDKTLRKTVAEGGYQACPDHYACPAGKDACLTECASVADCVDGYVCNGEHKCVKQLSAPTELPSCSAAGARSGGRSSGALAAAAIGLLAIAARRRRV